MMLTSKDTIMIPNDMKDAMRIPIKNSLHFDAEQVDFERLAEAQAEISFKAGMREARIEIGSVAFKKGKKAGVREVVEFIDWLDNGTRSSASWRSEMRKFRQAKLKE